MFSLDAQIPFPESVGISNEKEKMDKSRPNSLGCRDDNLHSVIWPYIYVIIDQRSQVSKMEVDANRSQAPCTGSTPFPNVLPAHKIQIRRNY